MMDFEPFKTGPDKYAVQVHGKMYELPFKYRNLSKEKLAKVLGDAGELKETPSLIIHRKNVTDKPLVKP